MKRLISFLIFAITLFVTVIPADAVVHVKGYYRKDGTYVQPHYRSDPDGNPYNNWSTYPNINPYTGKMGTKRVPGYPGYEIDSPDISPSIPRFGPRNQQTDYGEKIKQQNIERAKYWREQGYNFDPNFMMSYQMDQKVKDIERAKYWKEQGYNFDPNYMPAWQMNQKVKDTEQANYWKERGYSFDPNYIPAWQMDQKVKDIERAKYWKGEGYNFDPNYMPAWQMDQKVKDIERAKYWKVEGYNFDPNVMMAYQMDQMVKTIKTYTAKESSAK